MQEVEFVGNKYELMRQLSNFNQWQTKSDQPTHVVTAVSVPDHTTASK